MATTVKKQIDSIDRFLRAVGYSEKNAAEANTEPGSIGGATAHPVKDVDDYTEDAVEGARSAENTKDVKDDQGPASVENAKKAAARKRASARKWAAHDPNGSASDDQLQIGTKKQPTGEDPSVETSSVKAEKEDSETSHPASTDNSELDGNKYASMSTAVLYKLSNDLGTRVLISLTKKAEDEDEDEDEDEEDEDEEKDGVDIAGQAGWELAGLLSGQFDKRAADALVYSTLTEIVKTANNDADKAAVYLYSYQNELRKQAEEDSNSQIDPAALAAMSASTEGGGGGDDAALAQALGGGGGDGDDAALAQALGGGEAPEGEGGDDVEQLAEVLDQLGISPEELEAAMAAKDSEGAAPPIPASAFAGDEPNMEVEAAYAKQAAAKKGAANKNVRDYIQEVLERSRR